MDRRLGIDRHIGLGTRGHSGGHQKSRIFLLGGLELSRAAARSLAPVSPKE
jgi:hypothetical protein